MGSWDIKPEALHVVLTDVAADGQSMAKACGDAVSFGEETAASFGTASDVAEAFAGFWTPRQDIGQRIASLAFHKASVVAEAAQLFEQADGHMSETAVAAVESLDAGGSLAVTARGFGPALAK
jgi:hypothetical protein